MKYERWENVIQHLFVLCGIRKMDKIEHTLYLTDMFAELQNKFSDTEIGGAARQIAENENLFGAYPPLAIWLKYAPTRRLQDHNKNKLIPAIREFLHDIFTMEPLYFDADFLEANFIAKFGAQGKFVLDEFGGVRGLRGSFYQATQFTQENIIRDFIDSWVRAEIDVVMQVPQLEAKTDAQQIEQQKNH